jgi:hypothetical protein
LPQTIVAAVNRRGAQGRLSLINLKGNSRLVGKQEVNPAPSVLPVIQQQSLESWAGEG